MKRISRLIKILTLIQSGENFNVAELSKKLSVSERTIFRDFRTLEDAGIPTINENGAKKINGIYYFTPEAITEDEVNALIIAEKLIEYQGDTSLIKSFKSLVTKIRGTLRPSAKEAFNILKDKIAPSYEPNNFVSEYIIRFQKAITKNKVVEIEYHSIYKDEILKRRVEPFALYYTDYAWVVVAHCRLRNATRDFRLDRIIDYFELSETFENKKNYKLNLFFKNN